MAEGFTKNPAYQEMIQQITKQMMERSKKEQALKVKNYKTLNALAQKGGILFTGSSLMEQFPVCEMAVSAGVRGPVYNRGIGGTTTDDFLREIDTVLLDLEPRIVFINIGTNDMTDRVYGEGWKDHLEANYETILKTLKERLPDTEVYCMAYYPVNHHLPWAEEWSKGMLKDRTLENIAEMNSRVQKLAEKYGYQYIDVNEGLTNEDGEQKQEFAIDGVHMMAAAYEVVFRNLRPYLPFE